MYISRDLTQTLRRFSKFPVIALLGPRQSGKTTLVKHEFKKHIFVTLENPQLREFALNDPQGFLNEYENESGIIIDEFQYAPQLLSYIQIMVDEKKQPGYFILTGSQNFLVNTSITQSLAGRVGILTLLPLSIHELKEHKLLRDSNDIIFQGGYPRLYAEQFTPRELYPSYIHTYLERDVRQLAQVGDINIFQKFMRLCAGRVGQLLNIADLAINCGIDQRLAQKWLSVLEASYIIFLLKPHFNNFNKRLVKTPKLYFYDTGVACSLLDIKSADNLALSVFRGHLFENLIIADFVKQYYNSGEQPALYFWRDQNGRIEVDCLIDRGYKLVPVEIKAGQTIVPDFFSGITKWAEMAQADLQENYIVYAGDLTQKRSNGQVVSFAQAGELIHKIEK